MLKMSNLIMLLTGNYGINKLENVQSADSGRKLINKGEI